MKTLKKFLVPLLVLAILASFAVVPTSAAPADALVIYLGTENATGDGTSAASPLGRGTAGNYTDAPLYKAWDKVLTSGKTEAVIVFTDVYTIRNADCYKNNTDYDFMYINSPERSEITITYTSVYGGVDYRSTKGAMLTFRERACIMFPTTTVTENITIQGSQTLESGRHTWIQGGFNPLTLGQGTNLLKTAGAAVEYPIVCGAYRHGSSGYGGVNTGHSVGGYPLTRASSSVTIDVGAGNNVGDVAGGMGMVSHAQHWNSSVTIKSGIINGTVSGDSWGSDNSKLTTGNVSVTINGGEFKNSIALVHTGFAVGNTKTGTITVTGGTFNTNYSIYNRKGGNTATNAGAATFVIDCTNCDNDVYTTVKTCAGRQGLGGHVTAPSPFQNTTTGIRYKTLAEACAAANSGETIQMNASATETNVVIPQGVTLYLGANTLTANAVIGLAGSGIYGNTASCKIVVPQGNLILDETIYADTNGNSFLPYWDAANSCYKLSTVGLNTDGFGMTKTDTEITFKFEHALAQSARNVIGTAAADNGVKVAVQLRWMVGNNEAVQNFYFSDADFATVEGGGNYTFSLTNYAELGIDGATVEIQPMVVTDTGVVFYGETWVNGAIAQ